MSTQAIICAGLLVALIVGFATAAGGVGRSVAYIVLAAIVVPTVVLVVSRRGRG